MEDGFLLQFLIQSWRLWAIIFGSLGIAGFAYWRNGKKAKEERARKKEAILPQSKSETKKQSKKEAKKQTKQANPVEDAASLFDEDFEDDFPISSPGGSIFDDDELFPEDDDDIYAVQVESQNEISQESVETPEEEVVDLASLLSGMVAEPEEPKDYHVISDDPVAVKLVTDRKAIGRELLTILRDERDARLMVQISEVAYRSLENDRDAKKNFTTIMKELSGIILNPDDTPPDDVDVSAMNFNKMSTRAIDVQVSSGADTTAREMISILRDEADGHLIIQIGNTGYRTLTDQGKAKAGFSKIMKELSSSITKVDDNPPIVPQKAKPESTPPAPISSIFDEPDEVDDTVLPGDIRPAKMDDMPNSYKVGRFGRVKVNKVKLEDKVEDLNIADAIEAYLQYKIEQAAEFQNRGIHIRSAFGGGIRIEVDGAKYEFVDEVADDEARTFIKGAIDEWQERH